MSNQLKKCIILARPRTGSNLLKSYLNSLKNIEIKDEIFLRTKALDIDEIIKNSFLTDDMNVNIVGFKYFYGQPLDEPHHIEKVINHIKQNKDTIIIHLKRRNLLNVLVSQKLADKTGVWMIKDHQDYKIQKQTPQIHIPKKECWNFFKKIKEEERIHDIIFAENLKTEIIYEKLVEKPDKELWKLLNYFNLEDKKIETNLVKQNKKNINEVVKNYDKLKAEFTGTRFEEYFIY